METHHSNACLSIYGMGDAPALVIEADAPAFVMGDGMENVPAFVIKGNEPLETCISFTCIIGYTQ
jgi:hypothetical protein